jgi:hypothetical protein
VRVVLLLAGLLVAACGRIGYDAGGDDNGSGNGSDAAVIDAPLPTGDADRDAPAIDARAVDGAPGIIDARPPDARPPDARVADASTAPDATGGCPAICNQGCAGNVCHILGDTIPTDITCPAGLACEVTCEGSRTCRNVSCGPATACTVLCKGVESCPLGATCGDGQCSIFCMGDDSCGALSCGTSSSCQVDCSGVGSCVGAVACPAGLCFVSCRAMDSCGSGIDCRNACSCDATCGAAAACPGTGPVQCPAGCETATGCTSAGLRDDGRPCNAC